MRNKIDKKVLFSIIIGIILSLLTNVVAETLINSKDVSYVDNAKLGATNVQAAIDGTCTKFSTELQSFLLKVYPVNSVYISYSNTNPGTLFGGTWENIGSGKVLRGISSGTAGTTGGSETVTLKEENLPSHRHSIPVLTGTTGEAGKHSHTVTTNASKTTGNGVSNSKGWLYTGGGDSVVGTQDIIAGHGGSYYSTYSADSDTVRGMGLNHYHNIPALSGSTNEVADHTHTVSTTASNTGYTGSGTAFSTLDPYLTVYMWKRTK